jgi:hypothetical protein
MKVVASAIPARKVTTLDVLLLCTSEEYSFQTSTAPVTKTTLMNMKKNEMAIGLGESLREVKHGF